MSLTIFSHLPHFCCWQRGSRVSWFMPLSILFQSFITQVIWAGGLRRLMFCATFNNVSVIYHSFAVGRGFRRLMFYDTFNIVSVIYRTCAIGRGVQEAHGFCHFQYCFSHLRQMCYRQGVQESHIF